MNLACLTDICKIWEGYTQNGTSHCHKKLSKPQLKFELFFGLLNQGTNWLVNRNSTLSGEEWIHSRKVVMWQPKTRETVSFSARKLYRLDHWTLKPMMFVQETKIKSKCEPIWRRWGSSKCAITYLQSMVPRKTEIAVCPLLYSAENYS